MRKGHGMNRRFGWLMLLLVLLLLLAACGPPMATPTPRGQEPAADSPGATPGEALATVEPVSPGDLPVDPNDWRALGSEDAPVIIIEYSDFQ